MSKFNFIKKASLAFTSMVLTAGIFFSAGIAHATIPYAGADTTPSPTPAFNVFTGVDQGVGNEPDFLRARVPVATPDTSTPYVDPLSASCDAGQKIQMRVYVHNGTSVSLNENGTGPGIAHGTKVKVTVPTVEASTFTPNATISSTNVASVNDTATINCNGKVVKLKFVAGSASQFSIGTGTVALPDTIVTTGAAISSEGVSGDVWACWNERVYVILTVQVEEVPTPPIAVTSCDLLVNTGKIADNKYGFKVTTTATNGAALKDITYVYSDGTTEKAGATTTHLYTDTNPTKHVTATANFTVPGSTAVVSKTSDKCKTDITVPVVTPPVATPPAVLAATTTLPNTGMGSVVGIFAGTTILGAFLYRMRALRGIR